MDTATRFPGPGRYYRAPCYICHRDDPRPETHHCSWCRDIVDPDADDTHTRVVGGRLVYTHGPCRERERAEARRDERREHHGCRPHPTSRRDAERDPRDAQSGDGGGEYASTTGDPAPEDGTSARAAATADRG